MTIFPKQSFIFWIEDLECLVALRYKIKTKCNQVSLPRSDKLFVLSLLDHFLPGLEYSMHVCLLYLHFLGHSSPLFLYRHLSKTLLLPIWLLFLSLVPMSVCSSLLFPLISLLLLISINLLVLLVGIHLIWSIVFFISSTGYSIKWIIQGTVVREFQ